MNRTYVYVGLQSNLDRLPAHSARIEMSSSKYVLRWIKETNQPYEYDNVVVATFIVDINGKMWINDRRSEHVLCAHGENVLSAGEITFEISTDEIEVVEITNQSTGYCPEPKSWWAVERALEQTGISFPSDFTTRFIFRRCAKCGTKNIVKDNWYVCGVCQAVLSAVWNFEQSE